MDAGLKQRLIGAAVLVALAVIFLPMLVKGPAPDSGVSDVSLDVPPEPRAANGMVTQDLPLVGPAGAPGGSVSGMPEAVPAGDAPVPAPETPLFPAVAAGNYAVSFGSYASADDADKVIAALRSAELPAYREAVTVGGRQAQRVRIGPFADQAIAESARLRAGHVRDDVGAKVLVLDAAAAPATSPSSSTPLADARPAAATPLPAARPEPAKPAAKPVESKPAESKPVESKPAESRPAPVATKPEPAPAKPADTSGTGFAVQVGAFADAAAATALRDKLRAAGFNAFTDSVNTASGKRTRVNVGPAMTRAEADALRAQVRAKAGVDGYVRAHP